MLQGAISTGSKLPLSKRETSLVLLASLAICATIQFIAGAFSTDLSAHPDEPAHAVTGLMIRDYIGGGFLHSGNPMTYARDYYDRFPKVAIGHYPPAFYLAEAIWLLPSRSIAGCVSLITTLGATWLLLTHVCLRRAFPNLHPIAAFLPAASIPLLPMVGDSLVMVMSDLLLAVCSLGATMAFAKFIDKPSYRLSLLFGILAAAAGLTKASGLLLAMVPPVACLLSGRVRLLLDKRLWIAPAPVVLTVIPWILATRHITQEGMLETPVTEFFAAAARYYASTLADEFGIAALALGALFVTMSIYRAASKRTPPSATVASLASLALATLVFYASIPAGLEPRYLIPAAPSIMVFATGGLLGLIALLPRQRTLRSAAAGLLGLGAVSGFYALPEPVGSGFDNVSSTLIRTADTPTTILVSSDAVGEGAVIATSAFAIAPDEAQRWKFLRSTKALSTSDWMGRSYQPTVTTIEELASLLDSLQVTVVVEDSSIPERFQLPHNSLLHDYLSKFAPGDSRTSIPISRTSHSDRQKSGEVVIAELPPPNSTTE